MSKVNVRRADSPTATYVYVGEVGLLFSYDTIVAFRIGYHWVARENMWGPTTGKHLNEVSEKRDRIPNDVFEKALAVVEAGLTVADAIESEVERIIRDGVK